MTRSTMAATRVRRVSYALIGESLHGDAEGADPDTPAARVIDTLLHGAGPRP
ncbi:hypothetical protein ABZ618_01095 [Streptomyces roseolus]|uniref:hypothetical protein n=1 Tax=Streptomyces roseolus TaxID=67358 RepID=UPI0033C20B9D